MIPLVMLIVSTIISLFVYQKIIKPKLNAQPLAKQDSLIMSKQVCSYEMEDCRDN